MESSFGSAELMSGGGAIKEEHFTISKITNKQTAKHLNHNLIHAHRHLDAHTQTHMQASDEKKSSAT